MTTHFRSASNEASTCGATHGNMTAAPRHVTCPTCSDRLTAEIVAEIVRRESDLQRPHHPSEVTTTLSAIRNAAYDYHMAQAFDGGYLSICALGLVYKLCGMNIYQSPNAATFRAAHCVPWAELPPTTREFLRDLAEQEMRADATEEL